MATVIEVPLQPRVRLRALQGMSPALSAIVARLPHRLDPRRIPHERVLAELFKKLLALPRLSLLEAHAGLDHAASRDEVIEEELALLEHDRPEVYELWREVWQAEGEPALRSAARYYAALLARLYRLELPPNGIGEGLAQPKVPESVSKAVAAQTFELGLGGRRLPFCWIQPTARNTVVTATASGIVEEWDLRGVLLHRVHLDQCANVSGATLQGDHRLCVPMARTLGWLQLVDLRSGDCDDGPLVLASQVRCSTSGTLIAAGLVSADGAATCGLQIWNPEHDLAFTVSLGRPDFPAGLCLSPNARTVAVCGFDGDIYVARPTDAASWPSGGPQAFGIECIRAGDGCTISSMICDDSWLIYGTAGGTVQRVGARPWSWQSPDGFVAALALRSGGKQLCVASGTVVHVLDALSGAPVGRLTARATISDLCLVGDQQVVAACANGCIYGFRLPEIG